MPSGAIQVAVSLAGVALLQIPGAIRRCVLPLRGMVAVVNQIQANKTWQQTGHANDGITGFALGPATSRRVSGGRRRETPG